MTFSIVAWDRNARPSPEWGVAVASKFLGVGAVVPWARAGAGAVATQALANVGYGPSGLNLLSSGPSAATVVAQLTDEDEGRQHRQLGVVDARGGSASFTGEECFAWAGGRTGEGFCCQGNILAGPEVVDRMSDTFGSTEGELAARLLAALAAGDAAGGDRRGRQSAALLVVRADGGYGGGNDVALDLRVDDHAQPVGELARLFDLHKLYFPRPDDLEFVDIDDRVAETLRAALAARGYSPGSGTGYDAMLRDALYAYSGTENLEERWSDGAQIERRVLQHLTASAL
jgi:uncharacterized Ntn-hydrolase superfamily protein